LPGFVLKIPSMALHCFHSSFLSRQCRSFNPGPVVLLAFPWQLTTIVSHLLLNSSSVYSAVGLFPDSGRGVLVTVPMSDSPRIVSHLFHSGFLKMILGTW
ncbi:hypothetical protein PMAYCL1PPCAC_05272, partial [Pristionchus mayeri]